MTDPTPPGRRGRHASPDSSSGVPASAWLTSMPSRPPVGDKGIHPGPAPRRRRAVDDQRTGPMPGPVAHAGDQRSPRPRHPSEPLPDLPPMPAGAWSRLSRRPDDAADDATVGVGAVPAVPGADPDETAGHSADPHQWDDADSLGGLDVLGASGSHDVRRRRRGRRAEPEYHADEYGDEPLGGGRGSSRPRRRRSPLGVVLSLLVLAGLVAGIFYGGRALIGLVNPASEDFPGEGTGSVEVRVSSGDTLSDIARTLEAEGVIASPGPFVDAAETEPAATGIQPGVYALRSQMSGAAALDLLLDPASRMISRVTIPEGFTMRAVLDRLAETTGRPVAEFEAAVVDPAALGLPAYAGGQLEGYLFPATYEFEPDDTPVDMLRQMVGQFTATAERLQLEQRAAAVGRTPAEIVTVASMVQSETRLDEERADVAQVVYNRLGQGIPLGIDAALAYGLGKNGNDLTITDLQTDSPYNTRTRAGLPPTPISSPGEASLEAALAPSAGDLLYYVLENADGGHFFTADYAEFQAARARCAAAGLGCGG
ncbi:endolytic transglycosylase MltG [Geodermatophilus sp. URMC 61]|uniref:endolytic transglycosylase MltG n=1 Tax=Geodermatophilus sp. URMC 61 TaxID=3423411 RepID=UPI00406C99EF